MRADHLLQHVIRPTLRLMGLTNPRLNSPSAEILLLATACHESHCGEYLVQNGGPALGYMQIEPATHDDIYDNFLAYRPAMFEMMQTIASDRLHERLIWDLRYSTAIARLVYWRTPYALPHRDDIAAMAATWKRDFNTDKGRGTPEKFMADWRRYGIEL